MKMPPAKITELMLSRRKLLEKIMQNVATRKIQNSITATGDRMAATPQQFGAQLGKQMGKQSVFVLPAMGVSAGLGAVTAPTGHRMEGMARGATKGVGAGLGGIAGGALGAIGAAGLGLLNPRVGRALFGPNKTQLIDALKRYVARGGRTITVNGKKVPVRQPGRISPYTDAMLRNAVNRGGIAGAVGGGGLGYAGASSAIGKPSWEKKEASVLSVEKSEDTNKENKMDKHSTHDIVKNASAVLAQLRKNAGDTVGYLHPHARDFRKDTPAPTPQPMTGVAGAMKRVGDTSAKMPIAGVGVLSKMVGQNIGAAAPAVEAAGNKLTAGEKNMSPSATGGVNMLGVLPSLIGNLGRSLGGR